MALASVAELEADSSAADTELLSDVEAVALPDVVDALDSAALDDAEPLDPDPPHAASPKQHANSIATTIKAKLFLMMRPFPTVSVHGAFHPAACARQPRQRHLP